GVGRLCSRRLRAPRRRTGARLRPSRGRCCLVGFGRLARRGRLAGAHQRRYRCRIRVAAGVERRDDSRSIAGRAVPSGGTPPIHIPFFFEAAILSRMRSKVTSRSNWAKDNRTLRVNRPIEVVVLNCCVTETKDTPLASRISTILAKSASERVSRSTL